MKKPEFVKRIAEENGLDYVDANFMVSTVFKMLKVIFEEGNGMNIHGLGSINPVFIKRKPRTYVCNIPRVKGKTYEIRSRIKLKFRCSRELDDILNLMFLDENGDSILPLKSGSRKNNTIYDDLDDDLDDEFDNILDGIDIGI